MPELSRRVQTFTDSVIRRMTRISDEVDAINLSQGFPDFPPPKAITDRLREVADEGPHQYSVTFGAENFRRRSPASRDAHMAAKSTRIPRFSSPAAARRP